MAPTQPAPTTRRQKDNEHDALEVNLLKINARHGRSRDSNLENHCSARTDPHRVNLFIPAYRWIEKGKARVVGYEPSNLPHLAAGEWCSMEVIQDHLAQTERPCV